MEKEISQNNIKKRKIFYLAGYDPRGVRFYYQTLKNNLEKFCQRDNANITLTPRTKHSPFETHCVLNNISDNITTDYCFLHWDDFVKKTWIRSDYKLFWEGLKSYKEIICNFAWKKALSMPPTPIVTSFYPFLTLITFPLLVSIILSCFYHDYATPLLYFVMACLLWIQYLPKLKSNWLLRFFIFNHQFFMHYSSEYDARAKEFSCIIEASFKEDYDEILLIAHSNGSIATIPILKHLETVPNELKILTLGHCVPLITFNKLSHHYINIINDISKKPFKWFDICFPPDGACCAKMSPIQTYRDNNNLKINFQSISPQFFKYYAIKTYKKLLRDKFQLHFSYLVTHDKKSPTEFIDILTNSNPIEERFKNDR